jgi:hypothetical protein
MCVCMYICMYVSQFAGVSHEYVCMCVCMYVCVAFRWCVTACRGALNVVAKAGRRERVRGVSYSLDMYIHLL